MSSKGTPDITALTTSHTGSHDPMGALLLDAWKHGGAPGRVFEVMERSDGWIGVADSATYFTRYEEWAVLDRRLMDRTRGKVLDIGCGAGRHSRYLIERGYEVLAIDTSPGAVQVANMQNVPALVGSAARIPAPDSSFDTILLMGQNLGLLEGRQHAQSVLAEIRRVARPGAQILASGIDPYINDDPVRQGYRERNRAAGRLPGQMSLRIRYRHMTSPYFDYLFCSREELEGILLETAWHLEQFSTAGSAGYTAVMSAA